MAEGRSRRYCKPLLRLRALAWWVPFTLSVTVYGLIVSASVVFPMSYRHAIVRSWTHLNLGALRLLCGLRYRVHFEAPLPSGGAVIFCKHQSTWETMALNVVLAPTQLVWVLKRELLRIPLFGWGLAAMNSIAIDRGAGREAVQQMVEQGSERLARGMWVVVFPEGTRVRPGARVRYKLGGAVLAQSSGAPVVPIAHNAGEYWPRHSLIKWPGEIQMHVGPAIETRGKTVKEINTEAEAWIESRMAEITCLDRFPY